MAGHSHTLNDFLRGVPAYREAEEALDRFNASAKIPGPPPDYVPPLATVKQMLLTAYETGTTVDPETVVEEIRNARKAPELNEARNLMMLAKSSVASDLKHRRDQAADNALGDISRSLSAEFDALITEATPVFKSLGRRLDYEAAYSAGKQDTFTAARRLADRHKQLRTVQAELWQKHEHSKEAKLHPIASVLRCPGAVSDYWLHSVIGMAEVEPRARETAVTPGGIIRLPAPLFPDDFTNLEGLAWICAHPEAEPWLPTLDDTEAANTQLTTMALELRHGSSRGPVSRRKDAAAEALSKRLRNPVVARSIARATLPAAAGSQ